MTRKEMGQLRATTVFDLYQAKLATIKRSDTLKSSKLHIYRSSTKMIVSTIRSLCQDKCNGLLSNGGISGYTRHNATIKICKALKESINRLHQRVDVFPDV